MSTPLLRKFTLIRYFSLAGFLLAVGLSAATQARADNVNNDYCYWPAFHDQNCVIYNPVYVNVYWDTNQATWDNDVTAQSTGWAQARIDLITQAILRSGFFSRMSVYGVQSASWGGSFNCAGPPITVGTAMQGPSVEALVQCVIAQNPAFIDPGGDRKGKVSDSIVFNMFLPPQVDGSDFCITDGKGNKPFAKHLKVDTSLGAVKVTFNSTNNNCNSTSSNNLIQGLSHEMVEAASNPDPNGASGYRVRWSATDGDAGQEIGDKCPPPANPATPFLLPDASITQYWDNDANGSGNTGACTTGVQLTKPIISQTSVCGSGRNMQLTLQGTFGGQPWDLGQSVAWSPQTLYLRGGVSGSANWGAGVTANNLQGQPVNAVQFGGIGWQNSVITINGFGAGYGTGGARIMPGDTLAITVIRADTGQFAQTSLTAPFPSSISFDHDGASVSQGRVTDRNSCPIGNVAVALTGKGVVGDAAGPWKGGSSLTVTTNDDGTFAIPPFTTDQSAVAHTDTIVASVPGQTAAVTRTVTVATIRPVLTGLSVQVGDANGNQTIVLTGTGFDGSAGGLANNSVHFGSNKAIVNSVSADGTTVQLVTPKGPANFDNAGFVQVGAVVNGVSSSQSLQYRYVVPGVPVLTDQQGFPPCNGPVTPVPITLTMYNADGTVAPGEIALDGASGPSHVVQLPPQGPSKIGAAEYVAVPILSGVSFPVSLPAGGVQPFKAANRANPTLASSILIDCQIDTKALGTWLNTSRHLVPASVVGGGSAVWTLPKGGGGWVNPDPSPQPGPGPQPGPRPDVLGTSGDHVILTSSRGGDIAQLFDVRTFAGAELKATVLTNQNVEKSRLVGPAEKIAFTPKAIAIEPRAGGRSLDGIQIKGEVAFDLPGAIGRKFQVAHLGRSGSKSTWVLIKGAIAVPGRQHISVPISEPGVYALVSIE
jgi:hypothetical protein